MRDSIRTRVVSSGRAEVLNSEAFSRRALVEIVAALTSVDRAMRMTGSLESWIGPGDWLADVTTEPRSKGQAFRLWSPRSSLRGARVCWAKAGGAKVSSDESTLSMTNTIAILLKE